MRARLARWERRAMLEGVGRWMAPSFIQITPMGRPVTQPPRLAYFFDSTANACASLIRGAARSGAPTVRLGTEASTSDTTVSIALK